MSGIEGADSTRVLRTEEVATSEGLADWVPMLGTLESRFRLADFRSAVAFVNRIAEAAEEADHHPDIALRFRVVEVRLTSHDVGGLTIRDVELARRISSIAGEFAAVAERQAIRRIELALDTWDEGSVKPFWRAVLDLAESAAGELVDRGGVLPTIWFQTSGADTAQRWHVDLYVPPEEAQARISAALAAGGTMVSEEEAPSFTVLADPQGNRVCVCTYL